MRKIDGRKWTDEERRMINRQQALAFGIWSGILPAGCAVVAVFLVWAALVSYWALSR